MNESITKVKIKDETVEIRFKENLGNIEKESILKSEESPHPDFMRCLNDLVPAVYEILQLPSEWRYGLMSISSVSFSYSEDTDVEGAVITGQVKLDTANSPFCFNTPHLPFDQYSESGNSPLMKDQSQDKLHRLKKEAKAYINGKRAQTDLFRGD